MNTDKNLQESTEQALTIPVVMQRFKDFIDDYEKNIAKEKAFLSELDPIETCDDILYEFQTSYSDNYVKWLEEQCIINGVSGSLFNEEPKLKALDIIKKQNFNYENAMTYINEVLHFYRESYRGTRNKHYLNGLKYWNKIKYETQKEGDM